MNKDSNNLLIDRGIALHKMIRLVTAATAGGGYLNFMGNEFGHPEWIDFPREGNNWSYKYARRQWSLAEKDYLRYKDLRNWDEAMVHFLKDKRVLSESPLILTADEEKKILIFIRNNCIFAFNFNPTQSFTNYGFSAPEGEWSLALNSDSVCYNGFGRLSDGDVHVAVEEKSPNGNQDFDHTLYLYLPSRCALVLKKV